MECFNFLDLQDTCFHTCNKCQLHPNLKAHRLVSLHEVLGGPEQTIGWQKKPLVIEISKGCGSGMVHTSFGYELLLATWLNLFHIIIPEGLHCHLFQQKFSSPKAWADTRNISPHLSLL